MTEFHKIPDTEHYAILTTRRVYIPGDERSQTNPGHGYPASTETFINYESFSDRKAWEAKIDFLAKRQDTFKALHVVPAEITVTTQVKVKTP
jgi:hypothetical protein